MNDVPNEPSRRSRREARTANGAGVSEHRGHSSVDASGAGFGDALPGSSSVRDGAGHDFRLHASERASSAGFAGTWKPLVAAAVALIIAVTVGLLASKAFDGDTGRSVGGLAAALILGATGLALTARTRLTGFFSLRALDMLWALVLGIILPFLTGVFVGSPGFPALAALSPRWLLLGVTAPFVVVLGLTFFAIFFVYPATESFAALRLSPVWSRGLAAAVSTVAFVVVPVVFSPTVSGEPRALLIGLGLSASVFVALSRRPWGPLVTGLMFTAVWVAMSVAGYLLA